MQPLLRVVGIRKEFPGVRAVDFGPEDEVVVQSGEIRALVGENGAGKSTFVQMIAGIYEKNSGEIFLEGEPYEAANAVDAQSKGVAIVMQEPALLGPTLTISDNLLLGEENRYDTVGFLNLRKRDRIAKEILERFGLGHFRPNVQIGTLDFESRRLVELVKAMCRDPRVLIIDEAEAALSMQGIQLLFSILERPRNRAQPSSTAHIAWRTSSIFAIA